uniref:hypothetical protein n=1 Tax=Microbulbifer variabilis TaxID=266805 RepID=UPI001CFD6971
FTKSVGIATPYIEQAVGFWLFGGSEAASVRNWAPNSTTSRATVTGTPVYERGKVALTPVNYLDTGEQLDPQGAFTMIAVCTASLQTYCGTWHSGITDAMLYSTSNTSSLYFAAEGSGSGLGPISFNPGQNLRFIAGTKTVQDVTMVYQHDGTNLLSSSGIAGNRNPSANTYRVGPNGGVGDQLDTTVQYHAANLLFPLALSEAQILEMYDYLKALLAGRGVAML